MAQNPAAKSLLAEVEKCLYCGFCEAVCPTISFGPHRGYGPRGRLGVISFILSGGEATAEALASIYSCLTCGACTLKCPVGINVADLVKKARALYVRGVFGKKVGEFTIRPRRERW